MRFIYCIVGVAIEDRRVLLHKAEDDDFWALPGGRGELLEPAAATLRREMREELGIEVEVVRLHLFVRFEYCAIYRQAQPCKKTGRDDSQRIASR